VNLPIMIYMAGVNSLYPLFREFSLNAAADSGVQEAGAAVIKLLHLDAALICTAFTDRRDEIFAESSRAVMEMSTPVTEIWDGILLLPIVGIVDSRRSEDIMNAVLGAISSRAAREFILDISGVGVVDTAVANYLIRITKAASLMGCESTISGISPAIAQTIVQLGVDVGSVRTTATMMDALSGAFNRRGIHLSGDIQRHHCRGELRFHAGHSVPDYASLPDAFAAGRSWRKLSQNHSSLCTSRARG